MCATKEPKRVLLEPGAGEFCSMTRFQMTRFTHGTGLAFILSFFSGQVL